MPPPVRLKYLYRDRDRHGTWRWYVCPPGGRKTRLRDKPGSPAFLAAYSKAITDAGTAPPDDAQAKAGSLAWLCARYRKSAEWQQLAARTRYARGKVLERALANVHRRDAGPDGALPYRLMEPRHVRARRDALADRPEAANVYVKTLRQVFRWAIDADLARDNPAAQVPYLRPRNPDGFHTWTPDEVARFAERWPLGTPAYLAMALFLFTGVRRGDAATLGRHCERVVETDDGPETWLHFTEDKGHRSNPKQRALPLLPALRAAIDAAPGGHLCYLVSAHGRPYSPEGLGNRFRKWCDEAGLPHCSAHGLRKSGATIAAENGASDRQLMAIYGWESAKQATLYTRRADRARLAGDAMRLIRLPAAAPKK